MGTLGELKITDLIYGNGDPPRSWAKKSHNQEPFKRVSLAKLLPLSCFVVPHAPARKLVSWRTWSFNVSRNLRCELRSKGSDVWGASSQKAITPRGGWGGCVGSVALEICQGQQGPRTLEQPLNRDLCIKSFALPQGGSGL